jgi:hypothetical protein
MSGCGSYAIAKRLRGMSLLGEHGLECAGRAPIIFSMLWTFRMTAFGPKRT